MGDLSVLVWNVGGLNAPHKRSSLLSVLRRRKIDIALLQETHLLSNDSKRLANKFYHVIASSSFQTKTRGVAVVVKRCLPIKVLAVETDTEGRLVIVKSELHGRKLAIASVYAPNKFDKFFYDSLTTSMLQLTGYSLVVGADMNAVWDTAVDRSHSTSTSEQEQASAALRGWADSIALVDVWRSLNPWVKDYSFFSHRHKTFSRIDFLFASPNLFQRIDASVLLPIALSDHKAVFSRVTLKSLTKRATRWRFNSSLLKNEAFRDQFLSCLDEFLSFNVGSVDDPRVLWETVKCFIRSNVTLFSSTMRKAKSARLQALELEFSRLDNLLQNNYSLDTETKRDLIKKEINDILKLQSEFLIHRSRQRYYFHGSRPSHLLALRLRSNERFADIPSIRSLDGLVTTEPKHINNIFCSFYSSLYQSDGQLNECDYENYLRKLNLSRLSEEDASSLDNPLTLDELEMAARSMQSNKSPGLDGIPPEFYLLFWEKLGPLLLDMIQASLEAGMFPRDVNTALITLLLKKDRDPIECTSYRPLSLLNADLKIYAKLLARRIEKFMPHLVHCDQTGFIKGRLASDNMRRLLHVIDAAKDAKVPQAVLSVDALRAFDRLEWPFLWSVLQSMGFGKDFIHMVQVLYSSPSAQVLTGQLFSSPFPVTRSSRQGCPLSPSLFALSMEPLAQMIRMSVSIHPISILGTEHKVSLFADDVLVFMENPIQSLPSLLSVCEEFGLLSGFRINWTKSALLPLNPSANLLTFPATISVVQYFKYLGIRIFPSLHRTTTYNFVEMHTAVRKDMDQWATLPASLQARIAIVKMNVLPRINFVSSMIPLCPPSDYWKKLHADVSKFIWNKKRPRLKLSTLQRSKGDGGLAVPNFKYYFWSFILRPIVVWNDPDTPVSWRSLEDRIVQPWSLRDILFANISDRQTMLRFGPLISNVFHIWRLVEKECKISCKWHTLSPLFHNKALLIGGRPISPSNWSNTGVHYINDLYIDSCLGSFQGIRMLFNLPGSSFFFYLQIRSAMKAYGVPWQQPLPTHPLANVFSRCNGTKGMVSTLYRFILQSSYSALVVDRLWRQDYPALDPEFDWDDVWENIQVASRNPNHQQIHFNFIHRTYLTPRKLFYMKLVNSPMCSFCSLNCQGTFVHMVWECPPVARFWNGVALALAELVGTPIPVTLPVLILNDFSELNIPALTKRIVLAGLTAAKKLVATRWKPPHKLTTRQWVLSFLDVVYMELSTARIHAASERTLSSWQSAASSLRELLG